MTRSIFEPTKQCLGFGKRRVVRGSQPVRRVLLIGRESDFIFRDCAATTSGMEELEMTIVYQGEGLLGAPPIHEEAIEIQTREQECHSHPKED